MYHRHLPCSPVPWSSPSACARDAREVGSIASSRVGLDSRFVVAFEIGCVEGVRPWQDSWFAAAILCLVTLNGYSCASGATTLLFALDPFVHGPPMFEILVRAALEALHCSTGSIK